MNLKKALSVFGVDSLSALNVGELKKIYRKLAKQKHPDNEESGNTEDFVELREAYIFLSSELEKTSTSSTAIKELSKEEILDKYYHDTKDLQLKLDYFEDAFKEQVDTLAKVRSEVEEIVKDYETHKEKLKENLDKDISNLEKEYKTTAIKKLLFFLPKMDENQFWEKYNNYVQTYTNKHKDADAQFFKAMLEAYGDGLNDVSKLISTIK